LINVGGGRCVIYQSIFKLDYPRPDARATLPAIGGDDLAAVFIACQNRLR
jgi:hypothetical protein